MKLIEILVVALGGLGLTLSLIYISLHYQPRVRVIDCTWSEISPDFTNEMREQCRKARSESTIRNPSS